MYACCTLTKTTMHTQMWNTITQMNSKTKKTFWTHYTYDRDAIKAQLKTDAVCMNFAAYINHIEYIL